jgi:hypothetical protein
MITIRRPVVVKLVLTEQTKEKLRQEYKDAIRRLKLEMEQLQFQGKKLMTEAQKKGNEAVKLVQDRIGKEHRQRREKVEVLEQQLQQLDELEIGSEIHHGTVESECTVRVGDHWDECMTGTEIIIKDSIIVEIRQPKGGTL